VKRIFVEEADTVISNTGDSGYLMPPDETMGDGHPVSFPAKLTRLLADRWRHGGRPLTLFPCELVPSNGRILSRLCEHSSNFSSPACGLRPRTPRDFRAVGAPESSWMLPSSSLQTETLRAEGSRYCAGNTTASVTP